MFVHVAVERLVVFDVLPQSDAAGADQQEKSIGGGNLLGELPLPEAGTKRNWREEDVGLRLQPVEARAQRLRQRLVLGMKRQKYPQSLPPIARQLLRREDYHKWLAYESIPYRFCSSPFSRSEAPLDCRSTDTGKRTSSSHRPASCARLRSRGQMPVKGGAEEYQWIEHVAVRSA